MNFGFLQNAVDRVQLALMAARADARTLPPAEIVTVNDLFAKARADRLSGAGVSSVDGLAPVQGGRGAGGLILGLVTLLGLGG